MFTKQTGDITQLYDVKTIQNILGFGKNKTYEVVHSAGFPKIKIGRTYLVPQKEFNEWVKNNLQRSVII